MPLSSTIVGFEEEETLSKTTTAVAAAAMHRWLQQESNDTTIDSDDDRSGQDVASAVLSNLFLFFLIFGLSATVNVKNLKRQLTNKFAIGCGVLMQFLIMPLLGFLAVIAMRSQPGLTKPMGIALLVVTSSPGGSYSNWWCSMFNAGECGECAFFYCYLYFCIGATRFLSTPSSCF